jgi:hypothetical protein
MNDRTSMDEAERWYASYVQRQAGNGQPAIPQNSGGQQQTQQQMPYQPRKHQVSQQHHSSRGQSSGHADHGRQQQGGLRTSPPSRQHQQQQQQQPVGQDDFMQQYQQVFAQYAKAYPLLSPRDLSIQAQNRTHALIAERNKYMYRPASGMQNQPGQHQQYATHPQMSNQANGYNPIRHKYAKQPTDPNGARTSVLKQEGLEDLNSSFASQASVSTPPPTTDNLKTNPTEQPGYGNTWSASLSADKNSGNIWSNSSTEFISKKDNSANYDPVAMWS